MSEPQQQQHVHLAGQLAVANALWQGLEFSLLSVRKDRVRVRTPGSPMFTADATLGFVELRMNEPLTPQLLVASSLGATSQRGTSSRPFAMKMIAALRLHCVAWLQTRRSGQYLVSRLL